MPIWKKLRALLLREQNKPTEIDALQQDLQQDIADQEDAIHDVYQQAAKTHDNSRQIFDVCDEVVRTLRRVRNKI